MMLPLLSTNVSARKLLVNHEATYLSLCKVQLGNKGLYIETGNISGFSVLIPRVELNRLRMNKCSNDSGE